MSYDLTGWRALPGEDPDAAMDRLEELAGDDTPPDDAAWAEIERIGALLAEVDPSAGVHRDRARGYVEVSNDRFQVSVYEHECAVSIPYWTDDVGAWGPTLDAYVTVFREAGFTVHDPQTGRDVEVGDEIGLGYRTSAEAVLPVLAQYAAGSTPAAPTPQPQRRRWWPFGRSMKED